MLCIFFVIVGLIDDSLSIFTRSNRPLSVSAVHRPADRLADDLLRDGLAAADHVADAIAGAGHHHHSANRGRRALDGRQDRRPLPDQRLPGPLSGQHFRRLSARLLDLPRLVLSDSVRLHLIA